MFRFPYEKVKKGSKIVIYGAGTVGVDYVTQINSSGHCQVLFVLDRNASCKQGFPVPLFSPEHIVSVNHDDYTAVVIAVMDSEHSKTIVKYLIDSGVAPTKIIPFSFEENLMEESSIIIQEDDDGTDIIYCALYCYGGIGDVLFASSLAKSLFMVAHGKIEICFFSNSPAVLYGENQFPFIKNSYDLSHFNKSDKYDIVAEVLKCANIIRLSADKVKRVSGIIYEWCIDSIELCKIYPNNLANSLRFQKYALIKGRNRIEAANVAGKLPYDRHSPRFMSWDEQGFEALFEYKLDSCKYITISTGIENCNTIRNPKLWHSYNYGMLVKLLKSKFPKILIVAVGQNNDFGKIENVDIDLVGKTTLDEVKAILKYSLLHIGVEGGLVHLKHYLYGVSCCLFGPTSHNFLGHATDINITGGTGNCADGCESIRIDWMSHGCLISDFPICMQSITHDSVFCQISEFLKNKRRIEYTESHFAGLLCNNVQKSDRVAALQGVCIQNVSSDSIMLFGENYLAANNDVTFEFASVYNLPAEDCSFDIVICYDLENYRYPSLVLRELLRILRDDGKLLVEKNSRMITKRELSNIDF